MIRRYALWGSCAKFGAVILLAVLAGIGTQVAQAQEKPELPSVSLTGGLTSNGWETNYYPDGRIWVPRSGPNGDRMLIVPVFLKNCWRNTSNYEAFPIYSFKMKFQFDSTALQFVGIEKNGLPVGPQGRPVDCLAKDFEFSASVARDTTYQSVIGAPVENRRRGHRVMVTGISSKPLPQTGDPSSNCDTRPYQELFYLKFRVVANPASNPVSARTPIIVTNDTLFYNDFEVGTEQPFPNDPRPSRFAGLAGPDNYFNVNGIDEIRDPLRPHRPGMIWLEVTDEIPRLSFTTVADRSTRVVDSVDNTLSGQWFIREPLSLDSGNVTDDNVNGVGTRDIDVINSTAGSRLYYVKVQSDKQWLLFKSFRKGGAGETDPFPAPVREGYITYLDKGILGTTLGITPQAENTELKRDLNMRILIDQSKLEEQGTDPKGDYSGVYVGYLSFESPYLEVSPVRLKVTFIHFRRPFEPYEFKEGWEEGPEPGSVTNGMVLNIRNSNTPIEQTNITFGVGARATDGVDLLFGEGLYPAPMPANTFGARFFPPAPGTENGLSDLWANTYPNGKGMGKGPKGSSRDIRNIYSDSTLMYPVRFDAGSPLNYPIVVSWDTTSFIPGADLYIRDILNGSRFNVNMRNATSIGSDRLSVTIRDADINAFVIEYTLPRVMQFPVIAKGWNLLSLPVNPSSSYYRDVFRNGLNIPVRFTQNIYQPSATDVEPGIGYFVKYGNALDKTIAGSRINLIDKDHFPTKLYDGWNTIGSLSIATSVENIGRNGNLTPLPTYNDIPRVDGDVYRYITDRGYQAVSEIIPGLGYWIRIVGDGYYELYPPTAKTSNFNLAANRQAMIATSTNVVVADRAGRNADLYLAETNNIAETRSFELPPLPPVGLFDVRFANQAYVENDVNPTINIQGASFPVTVTVNNPARAYTAINPANGEILGHIAAGTTGSVILTDSDVPSVRLMGQDADINKLNVNVSPNPVATTGTVNVNVPVAGQVSVELYSSVGERVATIFSGAKSVGVYPFELNSVELAPGRYIVKVVSNGIVATSTVTIVR